jgi:hypothetical protein
VNKRCILILLFVSLYAVLPGSTPATAQSTDQEVFLQFRHKGVVNTYVSALYYQDQFYLSVSDLFNALSIDLSIDTGRMQLSGNFIGRGSYLIDLDSRARIARFSDSTLELTADDYILSELGYYLSPEIFYELFGMEFLIDFSNLGLTLESPHTMPVVAQRERELQRERMLRTQRELRRDFFPLRFDRNKQTFNGGFLDYNLTANYNDQGGSFLYNTSVGTELIGGDLQGTIFGSFSETATSLRSSGLRWRYGVLNNDYISTITAGQTTALGLVPVSYSGVKLTNEPIEPRFLYGETAFTGTVEPNSEVELYRNNSLVDYVQADETGQYRFLVPITYGASNYSVRVFSPTGEVSQRDARLQVPFNFLPPGEINYTVDAGRLDNPISGSTDRGLMSKVDVNAGLTNRFSALGGMEYFEDFHNRLPTFRGGVSSRLLNNYLISVEAASEAFYRASGSVIYPSNASINLDFTRYNTQGGIYNPSRNISAWRANIFTPFEIASLPFFLRWSVSNEKRSLSSVSRYRVDLNTRIGRANFRMGYRDTQVGSLELRSTGVARLSASATYNVSRIRTVPNLLRGTFLRAQANYIPSQSQFEDMEFQVSRNIRQMGRLQIAAGRNFIGGFNLFRFSFTVDFSAIRSVTTVRSTRTTSTFTQSLRGSIGYDSQNKKTLFTNRQQVGRSGTAVRLFVDNNNSGSYEPGEDELIPENAIRIDRAGGISVSKDGVHYISQLQPYRQYNLSVNKSVITNPLLVPELENFSIITDPNQYKVIDVPFYTSGIVEGTIYRTIDNGTRTGLGGLRLFMRQVNVPEGFEPYEQVLRTFSDGSFYAYEIPPGDYIIEPDSTQIAFLGAEPDIAQLEFTVAPLAQGDFVEGLAINLIPEDTEAMDESAPYILASISGNADDLNSAVFNRNCDYTLQLASFTEFMDAVNFAEQIEVSIGRSLNIVYNSRNELYTVLTSNTFSPDETDRLLGELSETLTLNTALISSCEPGTVPEESGNRHIQLAVFDNLEEAELFTRSYDTDLPYRVFVYTDPAAGVFRVLNGAYGSDNELNDMLQRFIIAESPESIVLDTTTQTEPILPDYRFSLKLGEFSDPDSARAFIEQFGDTLDVTLTLVQLDNDTYEVTTEEKTDNWEGLLNLGTAISQITNLPPPVARILPALPVLTGNADTADITTVTDTTRFRAIELDLADLPEDTVIVSGADTLVIRDAGIPVIEILEEEEFIVQPSDTLIANQGETTIPEGYPDLEQCTFPVQVGSFGGHTLAQEMADSITARIGTPITLFYNELTDLFALRTEGYESLETASEQVNLFRAMDPYNQYAIVGQCVREGSDAVYEPVRYLVPLIRYTRADQAEAYREQLPGEFREEVIIREDSDGFVNVYYGPFNRYTSASDSRERIALSDLVENPFIIIDPQTRNRFRAQFQVFLGTYRPDNRLDEIADRLQRATGRRVSVKIDDIDTVHLFEDNIYGIWSLFLDELRSISVSAGDDEPVEIFMID